MCVESNRSSYKNWKQHKGGDLAESNFWVYVLRLFVQDESTGVEKGKKQLVAIVRRSSFFFALRADHVPTLFAVRIPASRICAC